MNLVKINSINIWDEEWEVGEIADATGQNVLSSSTIRGKNYIDVLPSTAYYFMSPINKTMSIYQYDANKNFLNIVVYGNCTHTLNANTRYVRFKMASSYGVTYNNDLQICLDSESQKTTYHPHWVLGLDGQGKAFTADISSMLPSGIGVVDLGKLNWNIAGDVFESVGGLTDAYPLRGMGMVCSRYLSSEVKASVQQENKTIQILANGYLWIRDTDYTTTSELKQSLDGVLLFYRKSTS